MADVAIDTIVRAHYNSGTYIGEVKEDRGERYLIEVLAVDKHPIQGDLHNPGEVENVFFHERKALAHHEKMNVKKPAVRPFNETIPPYSESLMQAVDNSKEKLRAEDTAFNKKALRTLKGLEEKYYKKSYY